MKCCIISGSPELAHSKMWNDIRTKSYDLIICADSGYKHAYNNKIIPHIIVGDFDSLKDEHIKLIPPQTKTIKTPAEKDDTDTMLAVKTALEQIGQGSGEIDIYHALGGRLDHSYANIQTLKYILDKGITARLIGNNTVIFMLANGKVKVTKFDGYISLFTYSNECIVSISGVKYPLHNKLLTNNFPLGVSNEITGDYCEIKCSGGVLMVIKTLSY